VWELKGTSQVRASGVAVVLIKMTYYAFCKTEMGERGLGVCFFGYRRTVVDVLSVLSAFGRISGVGTWCILKACAAIESEALF
jgi:hypothetical protein